jgi:hypothetical protein
MKALRIGTARLPPGKFRGVNCSDQMRVSPNEHAGFSTGLMI